MSFSLRTISPNYAFVWNKLKILIEGQCQFPKLGSYRNGIFIWKSYVVFKKFYRTILVFWEHFYGFVSRNVFTLFMVFMGSLKAFPRQRNTSEYFFRHQFVSTVRYIIFEGSLIYHISHLFKKKNREHFRLINYWQLLSEKIRDLSP